METLDISLPPHLVKCSTNLIQLYVITQEIRTRNIEKEKGAFQDINLSLYNQNRIQITQSVLG